MWRAGRRLYSTWYTDAAFRGHVAAAWQAVWEGAAGEVAEAEAEAEPKSQWPSKFEDIATGGGKKRGWRHGTKLARGS